LRILDAATSLGDLAALNSNRLERLKGARKGQYSIRINDQWRICFKWPGNEPGPSNVEIVDYHQARKEKDHGTNTYSPRRGPQR
jgi:proteic killer suppression protein